MIHLTGCKKVRILKHAVEHASTSGNSISRHFYIRTFGHLAIEFHLIFGVLKLWCNYRGRTSSSKIWSSKMVSLKSHVQIDHIFENDIFELIKSSKMESSKMVWSKCPKSQSETLKWGCRGGSPLITLSIDWGPTKRGCRGQPPPDYLTHRSGGRQPPVR